MRARPFLFEMELPVAVAPRFAELGLGGLVELVAPEAAEHGARAAAVSEGTRMRMERA